MQMFVTSVHVHTTQQWGTRITSWMTLSPPREAFIFWLPNGHETAQREISAAWREWEDMVQNEWTFTETIVACVLGEQAL